MYIVDHVSVVSLLFHGFIGFLFAYFVLFDLLLETEEDKKDCSASLPDSSESKPIAKSSQSDSVNTETKAIDKEKDIDSVFVEAEISDKKKQVGSSKTVTRSDAQVIAESDNVPNVLISSETTNEADSHNTAESLTRDQSETSVINNNVMETVTEMPIETSDSKETNIKTKKPEKLETLEKLPKHVNITHDDLPHSPISPVYDPADFSYEEDAMPGKLDPIPANFLRKRLMVALINLSCQTNFEKLVIRINISSCVGFLFVYIHLHSHIVISSSWIEFVHFCVVLCGCCIGIYRHIGTAMFNIPPDMNYMGSILVSHMSVHQPVRTILVLSIPSKCLRGFP